MAGRTPSKQADRAATVDQIPVIAGLAAALALVASPVPAQPQIAAQPQISGFQAADPIGELIQRARGVVDDAFTAVQTELKATLYHSGTRGVGGRDSLGCQLQPMRTVAVDPKIFPRHSVIYIKETVGLKMPDGSSHDGNTRRASVDSICVASIVCWPSALRYFW